MGKLKVPFQLLAWYMRCFRFVHSELMYTPSSDRRFGVLTL